MTNPNNDRIGSHWTTCWRDGGRRHYACAVAEAERQIARAEAAEAQLASIPAYAAYYADAQLAHDLAEGPEPLDFAGWLAAGLPEGAA